MKDGGDLARDLALKASHDLAAATKEFATLIRRLCPEEFQGIGGE